MLPRDSGRQRDHTSGASGVSGRGKMIMPSMPVDTPKLLSILAHEIRGPVSALQGYLRVLDQQPHAAVPTAGQAATFATILDAMRKSTSKLAALGTDASDLASWLASPQNHPSQRVSVGALLSETKTFSTSVEFPPEFVPATESAEIALTNVSLMARALAALATAVARDHDQQPSRLTAEISDAAVTVHIAPGAAGSDPSSGGAGTVALDRGGMGLQLVLASHVFDTHGATATALPDGRVAVRIPRRTATS
jgi:hypothetical protein